MKTDPLKPLHGDSLLSAAKLETFSRMPTADLLASLHPGHEHSLKTKADGTMMDGHHRIFVLRTRGVHVDTLPREVLRKDVDDL